MTASAIDLYFMQISRVSGSASTAGVPLSPNLETSGIRGKVKEFLIPN